MAYKATGAGDSNYNGIYTEKFTTQYKKRCPSAARKGSACGDCAAATKQC